MVIDSANDYFRGEINQEKWKQNNKNFHKNLQRFCHYKQNSTLIDTKNGPIVKGEEYEKVKQGLVEWEDVVMLRNKKEIAKE